jgi:predicted O-methyltransferase YrrM
MGVASSDFEEARQAIANINGWLADLEAEALFEAAKACKGRGVIVEIGSWRGKSTICLALGSRAGSDVPVYAVDLHAKQFDRFTRNIERKGVADLVRPIRSRSQDVADDFHEPVELLFVDGSHDEQLVREDVEKWLPKVVDGGVVALHDTTWHAGPRKIATREIYRSRAFGDVRFVRPSLTIARKVAQNTARDRSRARLQLAKKTAFSLATAPYVAIKRALRKRARRQSVVSSRAG